MNGGLSDPCPLSCSLLSKTSAVVISLGRAQDPFEGAYPLADGRNEIQFESLCVPSAFYSGQHWQKVACAVSLRE